ncbi:MAG: acyl-CoA dehydrogenase family protein [Bdellovibrionales bacterium]|nr:acyl-CoA dehydrogenase family protein [Bdellovibrionales bacterium]
MSDSLFDQQRELLQKWELQKPDNFFSKNRNLQSSLFFWIGENALLPYLNLLNKSGSEAAKTLNSLAIETNRDENLPKLKAWDSFGNSLQEIDFHPGYHEMGRRIYDSNIMAMYDQPGQDLIQLTLFYLFAQNGEGGHACPLACTAGAIQLIQKVGSADLKSRFLPKLLDPSYDTHLHASQFLTELQGGSDVGANATVAVKDCDGSWRLHGEKWFCSVIDAGLFVLTARPNGAKSGTKGLMTFVAPRYLDDGSPNHFSIRRLKYKLGTRSMASAEIDLNGLIAYPVGSFDDGFKNVVEIVLNTSRLYNAFASAGLTQRAYMEAKSYAEIRSAFGKTINEFPLVQKTIAYLKAQSAAQLATSMHVAHLVQKMNTNSASDEEVWTFRFFVNANKYWTSIHSTQSVLKAIEVLGGNGAIEEFSVLPRLYRDSIVYESWEGSHNVLCQQVLKDMIKYQVHTHALGYFRKFLEKHSPLESQKSQLLSWLDEVEASALKLLNFPKDVASLAIRDWIDEAMSCIQCIDLLAECKFDKLDTTNSGKKEILDYFLKQPKFSSISLNDYQRTLEENLTLSKFDF